MNPPTIHRAGDSRRAWAIRKAPAQHADSPPPRGWVPPWSERAHAVGPMIAAHIILSASYPIPDSMSN